MFPSKDPSYYEGKPLPWRSKFCRCSITNKVRLTCSISESRIRRKSGNIGSHHVHITQSQCSLLSSCQVSLYSFNEKSGNAARVYLQSRRRLCGPITYVIDNGQNKLRDNGHYWKSSRCTSPFCSPQPPFNLDALSGCYSPNHRSANYCSSRPESFFSTTTGTNWTLIS
jgi:hypothetical protein